MARRLIALAVGVAVGLGAGWPLGYLEGVGPAADVPAARSPAWRVLRVIDGDTFQATGPGDVWVRVRLRNLDAPELDEPGGPEAREELARRIGGRRIDLRAYARDRYGRVIATIVERD